MASFVGYKYCQQLMDRYQHIHQKLKVTTMDRPVTKSNEVPKVGIANPKLDIRNLQSDKKDSRIAQEKERERGLGDDVRGGSCWSKSGS
ncbi:unnamed protein product [Umbelopsis vinacea]